MVDEVNSFENWTIEPLCKYCNKELDMDHKENIAFNNLEEVFHVICYEIREGRTL